jgi:hypothetical protein
MSNSERKPLVYATLDYHGWRFCEETDEDAIALYEKPHDGGDVLDLVEALKEADRELQSCQAVLWQLERDGVDPDYGKGAREARAKIRAALKKHGGAE